MVIVVNGTLDLNNLTIYVTSIVVLQPAVNKDFVDGSGVVELTSIAFLVNICGNTNTLPLESLQAFWLDEYGGPAASPVGSTLQDYYSTCSYNKVSFSSANNLIVGPIDLPCTGVTNYGANWSAGSCGTNDILGWAQYCENYATQTLGIDLTKYIRHILILPIMDACGWAGLASVGCGSTCYAWMQGGYGDSPDSVFHELGHNLGLQHSSTLGQEYGDDSSPMGAYPGVRCFNAAQNWWLGWSKPVATLTGSTLASGLAGTQSFNLQPTALNDTNFVRVVPSWMSNAVGVIPFYISYREAIGADSGLISMYSNKVSIHMFNGTQGIVGSYHSFLQAILNPGQSYVDTQYSNSRYTFVSRSGSTAMVSVCRFISSASECTESAPPPSPPHPPMHPNPLPPPPSIKASQPSPPPPPSPLPPKPLNLSPPSPKSSPPPTVRLFHSPKPPHPPSPNPTSPSPSPSSPPSSPRPPPSDHHHPQKKKKVHSRHPKVTSRSSPHKLKPTPSQSPPYPSSPSPPRPPPLCPHLVLHLPHHIQSLQVPW
ncbi:hypothetical protein CEUSTIGMA_g886.t1 [Chlamydomonas eustigma]|uniref:Peptidase M11 gametolysin domain-containing protein n=1 Tax=Chlamydomonas eustigma TaxID=1157962 RepID=A0A250WRF2_9CHLO|nr:hypothetical protein CEUSTIGMA_g886.t1 [Chlamydomonas eustigma]|eukprot:GAX73434.1 hypothetical protein CEUSTIGMA_g886.t1 [Chlamydomonas eustigma]